MSFYVSSCSSSWKQIRESILNDNIQLLVWRSLSSSTQDHKENASSNLELLPGDAELS